MKKIPVIGIGASAGGLKEFERFFKHMPAGKDVAFVLIQHLAPDHKSILAEIVKRYTEMDVFQVEDKVRVEAGKVYIIPPNKVLTIDKGKLLLSPMHKDQGRYLPIDIFFRSLKDSLGEKAIAVILSGTGSDGALGIKEVKEAGGLTIVQQPETADYNGMPISAIKTGLIDFIIPVEEMPDTILSYINNEFQEHKIVMSEDEKTVSYINQIFILIKKQIGHDFTNYKRNTILRRIERRLTVNKFNCLNEYVDFLNVTPKEVSTLYKELLISVTSFFRDVETFRYAEKNSIPKIVSQAENQTIRIWVPACATGEEAYSWAMLFKAFIDNNKLNHELQIFASDIDANAVEKAREGYYNNNIVADVPSDILERFFIKEKDGYRVKKSIRECVIFADQNLIQDPPYSRLDMVSCRNVLIYLDNDLQQKAISIFHYALKPNCTLVLGNSESLGSSAQYFKVVDRKFKIFTKIENIDVTSRVWKMNYQRNDNQVSSKKIVAEPIAALTKEFILDRYTPPSIVIDNEGEMIYIQGKTGKYLELSTGEVKTNIVKVAREGLKVPLINGIRKVKTNNEEVVHKNVRIKTNGDYEYVNLIISPFKNNNQDTGLLIVVFEPSIAITTITSDSIDSNAEHNTILELEKELADKEQYLQNTIEELETTNEELKSSNEEAQSTNEELQSTNEELETSKEELQSVNEELSTTNNELSLNIDQLAKVNNNLKNLLDATHIATIFLDRNLKIFSFTPSVSEIINLLQTDIGRSIKQFTNNLDYDKLVEDAKQVLKTLMPKEKEVQLANNSYFWMRILPYLTVENVVEGVVITFTDISEKKKAENELKESEEKYRTTFENSPDSIIIHDFEMNIIDVNNKAIEEFGFSKEEFAQLKVFDLHTKEERPHSEDVLEEMNSKEMLRVEKKFKRKNGSVFWADATPCKYQLNNKPIIHVVIRNITELKETKNELLKSKNRLTDAEIMANIGNWEWDITNDIVHWSEGLFKIFKIDEQQGAPNWSRHKELYSNDSYKRLSKHVEQCYKYGISYELEVDAITTDGEIRNCIAKGHPVKNEHGIIDKLYGVFQDITLHKNQLFLLKAQEIGAIGTWHLDVMQNILSWTKESYKIFGVTYGTPINYDRFVECVHPDDREYVNSQWTAALRNKPYDIEHRLLVNGEVKWVREKAELIFNKAGKAIAAYGVTQDITFKKTAEQELQKKATQLYELNRDKDKFISILAHDLKNPFNSLLGFSNLLVKNIRKYDIAKIEQQINVIDSLANRTFTMLEEILMWSRAHSGKIPYEPFDFYLKDMCNSVFELLADHALSKGITLNCNLAYDLCVHTDSNLLKTVLRNLLSNAIKFTGNGGAITIDATQNEHEIVIAVTDTGIGIEPDVLSEMFDIATINTTNGTNNEKGSGLGLLICKEFVGRIGGEIWAESKIGKGSVFYFSIPLTPIIVEKENEKITKQPKEKYSILIVDDDDVNYQLLETLLLDEIKLNCTIHLAVNGKEALNFCLREGGIDLILMDLNMPVMNGFDAILKIRTFMPNVPIVIVSANTDEKNKNQATLIGCSDFLEKPINEDVLTAIVEKYVTN